MWKKKKPSLTDQADLSSCTAQHSSPLHIPDSPATDAHRGSEEEVLLLQKSNSQVLTCPIHTTPWHQFRNVSFWWSNSRAQNLLKQLQVWSSWLPRDLWLPCREAANSNTLLGCGNRMIRVLKVHHNLDNSLPIMMSLRKSTQDAQGGLSEQHLSASFQSLTNTTLFLNPGILIC